jgi:hypothetical protein
LAAAEYVEDQASPPARRVERVGQTSELGASLAQGVDGVDFIALNKAGRSIAAPETCSMKMPA